MGLCGPRELDDVLMRRRVVDSPKMSLNTLYVLEAPKVSAGNVVLYDVIHFVRRAAQSRLLVSITCCGRGFEHHSLSGDTT